MATKPELGITNPYALDETQFQAAVDLLKAQRENITTYWSAAQRARSTRSPSGDMVVGTTWQYQVNILTSRRRRRSKAILPKEGATGWSDTWMISSKAKNPNCMYKWMDCIISPEANAMATVCFGEAPVSPQGCAEAEKLSAGHCDTVPRDRRGVLQEDLLLEHADQAECLDGRGPICTDFSEWTKAWTEIKG